MAMTRNEVKKIVAEAIERQTGCRLDEGRKGHVEAVQLDGGLGLDSLEIAEVVLAAEEKIRDEGLKVDIDTDRLPYPARTGKEPTTIGDVIDVFFEAVQAAEKAAGARPTPRPRGKPDQSGRSGRSR